VTPDGRSQRSSPGFAQGRCPKNRWSSQQMRLFCRGRALPHGLSQKSRLLACLAAEPRQVFLGVIVPGHIDDGAIVVSPHLGACACSHPPPHTHPTPRTSHRTCRSRTTVTLCRGFSLSPSSLDSIMNSPAGTITILGQSGQSRNTRPGLVACRLGMRCGASRSYEQRSSQGDKAYANTWPTSVRSYGSNVTKEP
jgi:hypothetical protein